MLCRIGGRISADEKLYPAATGGRLIAANGERIFLIPWEILINPSFIKIKYI